MDSRHDLYSEIENKDSEELEDEDELDLSDDENPLKPGKKERRSKGSMLTGRGVTMHMLIDDEILQTGEKLLSIDYLGRQFLGDLLQDGQIRWCETGQIFSSPSSWAMFCKKLVNPTKKSGCGWASVRYKGKKLDQFKSAWFRKQKLKSAPETAKQNAIESSPGTNISRKLDTSHLEVDPDRAKSAHVVSPEGMRPLISPEHKSSGFQATPFQLHSPRAPSLKSPKPTIARKKPLGRPPKNRPPELTRHPSPSSVNAKFHSPKFDSPPPLHSPRQISPKGVPSPMKSPPAGYHQPHHSRPSDFSAPIPGRTGNVMTFSEALELVKSQSAKKMEQADSYGKSHTSSASSGAPRMSTTPYVVHGRVYKKKPGRPPKDPNKSGVKSMAQIMPPSSAFSPPPSSSRGRGRRVSRTRMSLKHANVHPESDPLTLVECAQFASIGKIQPFSITVSTNSLLLIDFHCHLSTSEVTGYLAGKWDPVRQHLKVSQAYPCKCRIADKEDANQIENQIRIDMEQAGLVLVGWYHSHPFCQPDPTLQDIKNQIQYQQILKDENSSEPCIGIIVSPYDSHKKEAAFKAFWAQSHSQMHPEKLALPLGMNFSTQQDQQLSQDVVNEMVGLVNFYKGNPDSIIFTDTWTTESTYLDKIKHSAIRKFPQDQTDGRFLDFITKLLVAASS